MQLFVDENLEKRKIILFHILLSFYFILFYLILRNSYQLLFLIKIFENVYVFGKV